MLHSRLFLFPIDKFGKISQDVCHYIRKLGYLSTQIISSWLRPLSWREIIPDPCIQKSKWLNKYSWGGKANIKPKTSSDTAKTSFPDLFLAFEDFPIVVFVYVKNYFTMAHLKTQCKPFQQLRTFSQLLETAVNLTESKQLSLVWPADSVEPLYFRI